MRHIIPIDGVEEPLEEYFKDQPESLRQEIAYLVLRELEASEIDTEIQFSRRIHYWEERLPEQYRRKKEGRR